MSTEIVMQEYMFENLAVRIGMFNNEPWWVAKDVMAALGYAENSDVSSTTAKVPEEWRGHKRFGTLGGVQEMIALSEQGLYHFIARSDKPAALPFQKWLAGEVLPSIRKTGSYGIQAKSLTPTQMFLMQAQAMADQEERQRKMETQQIALVQRVEAIEEHRAQAAQDLLGLHPPDDGEEVAPLTVRAKLNRVVRTYAEATRLDYSAVWAQLYREFRERYHIDLRVRVKTGKRGSGPLDVAESLGCMDKLYKVAWELYSSKALHLVSL